MKRFGTVILGPLLLSLLCFGQSSASAPAQAAPVVIGHGAFPVKIIKTIDSSKLKDGDAVEVETAGSFKLPDGTLVPKGSKLVGHLLASKARAKGDSESMLTVAFDKLNIPNGKQLSVKGVVQAVFPPAAEIDPGVPAASTTPGANGGLQPAPDYRPMTEIKNGSDVATTGHSAPLAGAQAIGVQGLDNLKLDNGVVSSKGKNVKLVRGMRMIVRVEIFG